MKGYAIEFEDGYYADGQFDRHFPPNPYVTQVPEEIAVWDSEGGCHAFMAIFERGTDSYNVVQYGEYKEAE